MKLPIRMFILTLMLLQLVRASLEFDHQPDSSSDNGVETIKNDNEGNLKTVLLQVPVRNTKDHEKRKKEENEELREVSGRRRQTRCDSPNVLRNPRRIMIEADPDEDFSLLRASSALENAKKSDSKKDFHTEFLNNAMSFSNTNINSRTTRRENEDATINNILHPRTHDRVTLIHRESTKSIDEKPKKYICYCINEDDNDTPESEINLSLVYPTKRKVFPDIMGKEIHDDDNKSKKSSRPVNFQRTKIENYPSKRYFTDSTASTETLRKKQSGLQNLRHRSLQKERPTKTSECVPAETNTIGQPMRIGIPLGDRQFDTKFHVNNNKWPFGQKSKSIIGQKDSHVISSAAELAESLNGVRNIHDYLNVEETSYDPYKPVPIGLNVVYPAPYVIYPQYSQYRPYSMYDNGLNSDQDAGSDQFAKLPFMEGQGGSLCNDDDNDDDVYVATPFGRNFINIDECIKVYGNDACIVTATSGLSLDDPKDADKYQQHDDWTIGSEKQQQQQSRYVNSQSPVSENTKWKYVTNGISTDVPVAHYDKTKINEDNNEKEQESLPQGGLFTIDYHDHQFTTSRYNAENQDSTTMDNEDIIRYSSNQEQPTRINDIYNHVDSQNLLGHGSPNVETSLENKASAEADKYAEALKKFGINYISKKLSENIPSECVTFFTDKGIDVTRQNEYNQEFTRKHEDSTNGMYEKDHVGINEPWSNTEVYEDLTKFSTRSPQNIVRKMGGSNDDYAAAISMASMTGKASADVREMTMNDDHDVVSSSTNRYYTTVSRKPEETSDTTIPTIFNSHLVGSAQSHATNYLSKSNSVSSTTLAARDHYATMKNSEYSTTWTPRTTESLGTLITTNGADDKFSSLSGKSDTLDETKIGPLTEYRSTTFSKGFSNNEAHGAKTNSDAHIVGSYYSGTKITDTATKQSADSTESMSKSLNSITTPRANVDFRIDELQEHSTFSEENEQTRKAPDKLSSHDKYSNQRYITTKDYNNVPVRQQVEKNNDDVVGQSHLNDQKSATILHANPSKNNDPCRSESTLVETTENAKKHLHESTILGSASKFNGYYDDNYFDENEVDLLPEDRKVFRAAVRKVLKDILSGKSSFGESDEYIDDIDDYTDETPFARNYLEVLGRLMSLPQVRSMTITKIRNVLSSLRDLTKGGFSMAKITDKLIGSVFSSVLPDLLSVPMQRNNEIASSELTRTHNDDDDKVTNYLEDIIESPGIGIDNAKKPLIRIIIIRTVEHTLNKEKDSVSRAVIREKLDKIIARADENRNHTANKSLSPESPPNIPEPKKPIESSKNLPIVPVKERVFENGHWSDKDATVGDMRKYFKPHISSTLRADENKILSSEYNKDSEVKSTSTANEFSFTSESMLNNARSSDTDKNAEKELTTDYQMNIDRTADISIFPTTENLPVTFDSKTNDEEKVPIKYYSPADRILAYKKNVQSSQEMASMSKLFITTTEYPVEFESVQKSYDDQYYSRTTDKNEDIVKNALTERPMSGTQKSNEEFIDDRNLKKSADNEEIHSGGSLKNSNSTFDAMKILTVAEENRDKSSDTPSINNERVGSAQRKNTNHDVARYDPSYFGRITVDSVAPNDGELSNLINKDLFYIGDSVKLPLKITRMADGSWGLSISEKICDTFVQRKCPCCVPNKGDILEETKLPKKRMIDEYNIETMINTYDYDSLDPAEDSDYISEPRKRHNRSPIEDNHVTTSRTPVKIFMKKFDLKLDPEEEPEKLPLSWRQIVESNADVNDEGRSNQARNSINDELPELQVTEYEMRRPNGELYLIRNGQLAFDTNSDEFVDGPLYIERKDKEESGETNAPDNFVNSASGRNDNSFSNAVDDNHDYDMNTMKNEMEGSNSQTDDLILRRIKFIKKKQEEQGGYRYQRTIDSEIEGRVNLLKNVLRWFKEIFLESTSNNES